MGTYLFVSDLRPGGEAGADLPEMSRDGGSEEEFQRYWAANAQPRQLAGGWFERLAHPQVNVERYWCQPSTGALVWQQPRCEGLPGQASGASGQGWKALTGSGPAWEMTVKELKAVLRSGQGRDYGLTDAELAKRAVAEYEKFAPRVLSWHDYQYNTFWFFGGMENRDKGTGQDRLGAKSFFDAGSGAGRELFASDSFFHAAAALIQQRLDLMHPINLTYFIWTFSRANVVVPELMQAVGDHLCKGWIPMFDRCSLGTMVWNFSKQGIRHDRFFEAAAVELSRPNRLRSLAPRNFQNSMIAFSRRRHWNERFVDAMARGIPLLLDRHDPRFPKTDKEVLFSYTCKDGSEVPADAFRIGGLTVIVKAFQELKATGPEVERCLVSMLNYVKRSVARSPPMMREPGDACAFVRQLAFLVQEGLLSPEAVPLLGSEGFSREAATDLQRLCQGASEQDLGRLRAALRRAGLPTAHV